MPPDGDGFYYFSVFLTGYGHEKSYFDVELNGELICTVFSDLTLSTPVLFWLDSNNAY